MMSTVVALRPVTKSESENPGEEVFTMTEVAQKLLEEYVDREEERKLIVLRKPKQ